MQSAHGKVTSTIILHPKKHKLVVVVVVEVSTSGMPRSSAPASQPVSDIQFSTTWWNRIVSHTAAAALALRDESAWDKPIGTQLSCCSWSVCGPARGKSSLNHKRAITTGPSTTMTATTEERQPQYAREIKPGWVCFMWKFFIWSDELWLFEWTWNCT